MTTIPTLPTTGTEARTVARSGGQRQPAGRKRPLFDPPIVQRAIRDAFRKLDPRHMVRNPVMFVVLIGSVWTTVLFFRDLPSAKSADSVFVGLVSIWLWFTVLFANFAEAVAEGRGKAQADTLRKTRSETVAYVRQPDGAVARDWVRTHHSPAHGVDVVTAVYDRLAASGWERAG